jgi:hypothetical protein
MKKIILILMVFALNVGVNAQNPYGAGKSSSDSIGSTVAHVPDGFVSKDGKTIMVKDGKFTPLKKDMTLPDGSVVKTNGTFKSTDGTEIELKEGDHLDFKGKLSTLIISKDK